MRDRPVRWGLLPLLFMMMAVDMGLSRPQTKDNTQVYGRTSSFQSSNEERSFFAPGSWQPVSNAYSGLVIDQAPSRVRLEQQVVNERDGRSRVSHSAVPFVPARDGRSKVSTTEVPLVAASTNVTDNSTLRAKSPSPLGDAIKLVASQLLQSRGGVAEEDVRAPPPKKKIQSPPKKEESDLVSSETKYEGVAIPVLMDEVPEPPPSTSTTRRTTTTKRTTSSSNSLKRTQVTTTKKPVPPTTIPDGLTTWVFLSGSSPATYLPTTPSSTLSTRLTTKKTQRVTTTPATTPTHSIVKKHSVLFTSSGTKPNRVTKKPVAEESVTTANKRVTTTTQKPEVNDRPTALKLEGEKQEVIAFRRRPVTTEAESATSTTTTSKPFPTAYPLSTVAPEEGTSGEDESGETTTKRTRTTEKKKKKKNKNKRRRRPVVKPPPQEEEEEEVESKVEEEEEAVAVPTKNKPARPLSTRIYNFIAREIMPSVGVGLIGLVGLAGLAGLIMYPFGGGTLPIRRNYQETPKPNYYYYENEEGGQSEEEVLGKVLAGMKDNTYLSSMKDPAYVNSEQTYQEPENRKAVQGDSYTRYDAGGRISSLPESQPIRSDYDANGRISPQTREGGTSREEEIVTYGNNRRQETRYEADDTTRVAKPKKEMVMKGSVHNDDEPVHYRGVQKTGDAESGAAAAAVAAAVAPQASALYATRNEPRPVFNNDWSIVTTEAKVPMAEERYRYEAEAPQYSGVSRVGVGTVEHGPRRLRRDVTKKDAALPEAEDNEIVDLEITDGPAHNVHRVEVVEVDSDDGDSIKDELEEQKTTKPPKKNTGVDYKKTSTVKPEPSDVDTITSTASPDTYTDSEESSEEDSSELDSSDEHQEEAAKEATTTSEPAVEVTTNTTEEPITLETESPEDPSLMGLIRRVAQYKIRLGLSFLRNTSQAFSRYLGRMQKRVEEIVKENAQHRNKLYKSKAVPEDDYY